MKSLFTTLAQKLDPFRSTLLHALCFSSFAAVALGWSLLDRLGPMGVILPGVAAIGTCLSEIDRFLEPRYVHRPLKARRRRLSDRTTA